MRQDGTELDIDARARFAARDIQVVDTPVNAIESADGDIAGVRLSDGRLVARRVLAVATRVQARTEGLDGLRLPMQDLPGGMGRSVASGRAGLTEVPGVWVAGNATDLLAQVGASAAAGALAGAHMNAHLVTADTDADLAELKSKTSISPMTPPGSATLSLAVHQIGERHRLAGEHHVIGGAVPQAQGRVSDLRVGFRT